MKEEKDEKVKNQFVRFGLAKLLEAVGGEEHP